MPKPLVAMIVPTFERPESLRLVLASLALQKGLADDEMEIVVADDGSQDHTAEVVKKFRAKSPFNVIYTTHKHDGFQLARTRNDGVRASSAPYILFLDGDCVAPANHVAQHLRHRAPRTVMAGFYYYLDRETSAQIDEDVIGQGNFERFVTASHRRRLSWMDYKARFYAMVRHPQRPKIYGGDIGIWRDDYEAVNGFNEEFMGWGCEDDEFGLRLRKAGIRIRSVMRWTRTYHLWHPPVPSHPGSWKNGANVRKLALESARHSPRCEHGLQKHAA